LNRFFRQFRLLPLVIFMCGALIALKGANLIVQARAGAPATSAPVPPSGSQGTGASAAMLDDNTDSASEIDVLTSLAKRRRALDQEARALDMRANLLTAAENRVDAKIADLKNLKTQIQTLLGQRDAAEAKQVRALIKVYSAMKPRNAGRIFDSLDQHVLLEVASGMQPDALASILSAMAPQNAQALTVALADRLRLPQTTAMAPTAQAPQKNTAATPRASATAATTSVAQTPVPAARTVANAAGPTLAPSSSAPASGPQEAGGTSAAAAPPPAAQN
jgi:flagellar motility protein MotE (MotC chaperone)